MTAQLELVIRSSAVVDNFAIQRNLRWQILTDSLLWMKVLLVWRSAYQGSTLSDFICTRVIHDFWCPCLHRIVNWNWDNYDINYYLQYSQLKRETIPKLTICIPSSLDPFDSLSWYPRVLQLTTWLRMSLHDKLFLLNLSHLTYFFPPHLVEAISQSRSIMNFNFCFTRLNMQITPPQCGN